MTGFRCPSCRAKFTNVTITDARVCCPQCGELMFTVPAATTRAEFNAALSRDYFIECQYQLADFYPGWNAKKIDERLAIADRICTEVMRRLPEG